MAAPVTYNPTVAPEGNINASTRIHTPPLDNTGAAMAMFGGSLDNLAMGMQHNQDRAQALMDQDAIAQAHVTAAQTAATAHQQLAAASSCLAATTVRSSACTCARRFAVTG